MTAFPELIAARRRGDHATTFEVTEDWLQGRTSFGGLISAYAVQAMRDVAGAGWPANVSLRALQTSFIAPIGSGKVDVAVRLLREGKSVRQVQAEVRKDGQTCSVMLGVFAVQRASALAVLRPTRPAPARQVDELASMPIRAGSRTELPAAFRDTLGRRTASVLGRLRIGDQHPHAAAGARCGHCLERSADCAAGRPHADACDGPVQAAHPHEFDLVGA
jgi:acyl-CoA thioesterase